MATESGQEEPLPNLQEEAKEDGKEDYESTSSKGGFLAWNWVDFMPYV